MQTLLGINKLISQKHETVFTAYLDTNYLAARRRHCIFHELNPVPTRQNPLGQTMYVISFFGKLRSFNINIHVYTYFNLN